jgi:threonine aldolase
MGSVLCAGRDTILQARRIRKMLGGGVRQAGVVAAAGLAALDYLPRLGEDHAKARRLAEGLRRMGFTAPVPQTNILFVPVPDAAAASSILEEARVRALAVGSCLRFVTHRDLSEAEVEEAVERIRPMAERLVTTWEGNRPMV